MPTLSALSKTGGSAATSGLVTQPPRQQRGRQRRQRPHDDIRHPVSSDQVGQKTAYEQPDARLRPKARQQRQRLGYANLKGLKADGRQQQRDRRIYRADHRGAHKRLQVPCFHVHKILSLAHTRHKPGRRFVYERGYGPQSEPSSAACVPARIMTPATIAACRKSMSTPCPAHPAARRKTRASAAAIAAAGTADATPAIPYPFGRAA